MAIDVSQRQKQLRRALNVLYARQANALNSPPAIQRQIQEQIDLVLRDLREMKRKNPVRRRPSIRTSTGRVVVNFCLGCNAPIERGQQAVKYADYGLCCNFRCFLKIMTRINEDKKKTPRPL